MLCVDCSPKPFLKYDNIHFHTSSVKGTQLHLLEDAIFNAIFPYESIDLLEKQGMLYLKKIF